MTGEMRPCRHCSQSVLHAWVEALFLDLEPHPVTADDKLHGHPLDFVRWRQAYGWCEVWIPERRAGEPLHRVHRCRTDSGAEPPREGARA